MLLLTALAGLGACSNLLFYPDRNWRRTPADLGLSYRDVTLTSADGTSLSAWWLDTPVPARGTVLFLHGNAENISTHLAAVYWLPAAGYQVLLLDYRGYGRSAGVPELPGIFDDIAAAVAWVQAEPAAAHRPVYVLGQSLGATMGGYVLATRPELRAGLTGIILEAGFARYAEIARHAAGSNWLTWSFQYFAGTAMPDGYDLIDYIGAIAPTPLLIIHGTQDQVIPFSNGERLYAAAGDPKAFLRYDGPHIAAFRDTVNRDLLLDFMERAARQSPGATQWDVAPP